MEPEEPVNTEEGFSLGDGIPHGEAGKQEAEIQREPNPIQRFLKILGPGLITGASDDDPSGIGTYAKVGASFGYLTLWASLFVFPMMAVVQFSCAKIGLVTGRGLAGVLHQHYSKWILYPAVIALLIANTINAAADIRAIAAGVNLLIPIPILFMIVPCTLVIMALLIWGSYQLIVNVFKWLTLALFSYVGASLLANPDWGQVLRGTFIPTIMFNSAFLAALVAILGTNISPYLFFWQSSQEAEEKKIESAGRLWRRRGASSGELRRAAWDTNIGMFFSNLIVYSINLATAATLFTAGMTTVESAADAAAALRPLAGDAAEILFALGLIGSGFLGVPVLVGSSAYAVAEGVGWKRGLNEKPERAWRFYAVIAASMLIAMLVDFIGINPIDMLFWSAVINGLVAPPLLVLIMIVVNNKAIMGTRVNSRSLNLVGWLTTAVMFAAAIGLIVTWGS